MIRSRIMLILLGGPGPGKGTQAQALIRRLEIPQISTGDLLRAEIKERTEVGLDVEKEISAGKLVSDKLVDHVLAGRVRQPDCLNGWILDGYPRTLAQAVTLQ